MATSTIVFILAAVLAVAFCCDPPDIPNGMFTPMKESYSRREGVRFSCKDGYALFGNKGSQCQTSGGEFIWTHAIPVCKRKSNNPDLISH
jgi:hypothetical protein